MIKVTYITHSGEAFEVEAQDGQSVMEAAVKQAVPGIDADCGGACACATCHIYVDDIWLNAVGAPSEMEQAMLDFANEVGSNSRLACQIKLAEPLNGLVVRTPKSQH